jgi:hypothetical protein
MATLSAFGGVFDVGEWEVFQRIDDRWRAYAPVRPKTNEVI